jgi:hypothetical protein
MGQALNPENYICHSIPSRSTARVLLEAVVMQNALKKWISAFAGQSRHFGLTVIYT